MGRCAARSSVVRTAIMPRRRTPRCEMRIHRGEAIFLWWSGAEVHAVVRVEVADERIARLWNYYHAPELLSEVCRELAVPFRTHGYLPHQI